MKRITVAIILVMIAVMLLTFKAIAVTPDLNGTILDEKGEPMPFVNVVLLSLPDSAYVQGAMTDEQGRFLISTPQGTGVLKVSSIGYETLYVAPSALGQPIQMREATLLLGEVVIKSQLPKTFVKGEAMRTTVAGTLLEKAGTVTDALKRVPSLEAERDGGVKVLGRGDAEVYINGRKVQDNSELSRLRSDQIQHIDVIQNPGARYAASTRA
ncbi:MAG: carboxypeptidase-like regulatory domain-containing protein, partial [Muribaculaceae bacterium]|nr:carboxypeptidase-like regulatory domain-containing protein [Muribaculaceae bacterium]